MFIPKVFAACAAAAGSLFHPTVNEKESSMTAKFDDNHQVSFAPDLQQMSGLLAAGNTPMGTSDLERLVNDTYLNRMPESLGIGAATFQTVQVEQKQVEKSVKQITIRKPTFDQCKPKISGVTQVASGLYCDSKNTACSISRTVTIRDSYGATSGYEVGTSITMGGSFFVSVSLSASYTESYTSSWEHAQESSNTYTFTLGPGESCIPSMMHVDLLCEYQPDEWWWDCEYSSSLKTALPASQYNRGGGPYAHGQWCRMMHVSDSIAKMDEYWQPLLEGDKDRGFIYTRPASTLNGYKTERNEEPVDDSYIAIRQNKNSIYPLGMLFVCQRYWTTGIKPVDSATVPVALSSENGLLGYVGCV